MQRQSNSRRRLIAFGLLSIPMKMRLVTEARADSGACADVNDGLRTALHYIEQSPDTLRACAGCVYFAAADSSRCGSCQIFSGPANRRGHCDSWSAKG
jgi:hypothetical protein